MADIRTLAIDIGGTGLKASVLDQSGTMVVPRVKVATPYPNTPQIMLDALATLVAPLPAFDRISTGFPGFLRDGIVITAPHFGDSWRDFPLADALGKRLGDKPSRALNDAEVQGFGAMKGNGLELVITLGTGLGTAFFRDGILMPHMEFAQWPVRSKTTFNAYVGNAVLAKIGPKKWNRRVSKTIDLFRGLVHFDRMFIGGGNATKFVDLPSDAELVSNELGMIGGIKLWDPVPKAKSKK
jgi:polyphosphate glucokinase